ncbi:ATP-binding cassette domain-containing protein [Streptomyces alkaliterrae]|uniref:ATP-binding cassette domain-containing protein n=1 Tax=Streptomyces alkaliterrae TaxID=2213162 RepID=A0A5P0YYQ6_9ACTN|nr:ATP-binding cassette domain-containing protein [Streptomyces alkaliterrae]MBB1261082.1 ATP-binding cassette domain-containing protein [Streptomyces alkaliterrae]MQS03589.1 ATP-binding cassette domain-containing protein [Streptomyces alkaliterrae]
MSTNRLVCEDVTKDHGGSFTLGPLNLEIAQGVTCLVGPNGAGKSTFFRLAASVDKPTSGALTLHGPGGPSLGYLPQEPQLPKAATCEEFLLYVAWLQRIPTAERARAVSVALERTGLTEQRKRKIRQLSGGMARRLGIAHTLVHDPALLLLDEPTVGLDPRQRIALRESISHVSADRIVIVSTHLVEDVRGLADRVVVLNDGSVAFDGDIPSLEELAAPDAPGDTDLERSIATLMGDAA